MVGGGADDPPSGGGVVGGGPTWCGCGGFGGGGGAVRTSTGAGAPVPVDPPVGASLLVGCGLGLGLGSGLCIGLSLGYASTLSKLDEGGAVSLYSHAPTTTTMAAHATPFMTWPMRSSFTVRLTHCSYGLPRGAQLDVGWGRLARPAANRPRGIPWMVRTSRGYTAAIRGRRRRSRAKCPPTCRLAHRG